MKRYTQRITASVLALAMTVALTGCGPDPRILKGAVAAFTPLVQYLITQGKITPDKAAAYTKDATDLIDGFAVLQADWAAAGSSKPAKADAAGKFANKVAEILARGNFGKIPQLNGAMIVLNTTLAVLQVFYGGSGPTTAGVTSAAVPKDEGALNDYVKQQSELLKQMLQPK